MRRASRQVLKRAYDSSDDEWDQSKAMLTTGKRLRALTLSDAKIVDQRVQAGEEMQTDETLGTGNAVSGVATPPPTPPQSIAEEVVMKDVAPPSVDTSISTGTVA